MSTRSMTKNIVASAHIMLFYSTINKNVISKLAEDLLLLFKHINEHGLTSIKNVKACTRGQEIHAQNKYDTHQRLVHDVCWFCDKQKGKIVEGIDKADYCEAQWKRFRQSKCYTRTLHPTVDLIIIIIILFTSQVCEGHLFFIAASLRLCYLHALQYCICVAVMNGKMESEKMYWQRKTFSCQHLMRMRL